METVQLTDVTLRDGLQMEAALLPTAKKLELFRLLKACGYDRLEVTSFVNPKWVPQFQDTQGFCEKLYAGAPGIETMAFVPNEKGLELLLAFPIPWVSTFVATSEEFNRKNVNATITETLAVLGKIITRARAKQRKVRIYVSTVFGCPYLGAIPRESVLKTLKQVVNLGADEVALSDTIGVAVPDQIDDIVAEFLKLFPTEKTALHLHNTYGMGLASAVAAHRLGIRKFDGTTGGIGGCPYAKGASGNIATDELAYLFFSTRRAQRVSSNRYPGSL